MKGFSGQVCSNGLLKKKQKRKKKHQPLQSNTLQPPPKVDLAFPAKGPKSQTPQVVWLVRMRKKCCRRTDAKKKCVNQTDRIKHRIRRLQGPKLKIPKSFFQLSNQETMLSLRRKGEPTGIHSGIWFWERFGTRFTISSQVGMECLPKKMHS